MMKKMSVLFLSLFLIFAFGSQVYALDMSAGPSGVGDDTTNEMRARGFGATDNDNDLGRTLDRTNTINDNQANMRGYNNNFRANAAGDENNNWGWLGILGLLGLAGMMGRNRNPEK